ncbi:MAG: NgoPII family restriction endonuclease [Ghiorsea sp.]
MSNILQAILNIDAATSTHLNEVGGGANRINNMGEALEGFVKNAFANTLNETDIDTIADKHDETFSYGGNANNIPDAMLLNGDAIEVKKIENFNTGIPLNSSYPKDKLYADDHRVNQTCRNSEHWQTKDMVYAIGIVQQQHLKHLWLIDGACYAADRETYARIEKTISHGVNEIADVEFSVTKELGRVNKVDPLGITYLRIRGMWHIDNPSKVFQDIYTIDRARTFGLAAVMRQEKYHAMPEKDKRAVENNENIEIQHVKIQNPNNPVKRLAAVLISISQP